MFEVAKYWLLTSGILIFISSCATPIAPVGRPLNKTSPTVVKTNPQSGRLMVKTSLVELTFNRYMNRNSLRNQLQIEPDLGLDYDTYWKRKSLYIDFNRPIPDSVTVILTLGAQLMDVDGNALGAPYRLGFSSGNRLDSAKIDLTVRSFNTGKGESGHLIGLFRKGDALRSATYLSQSDSSGKVNFSFLSEGWYDAFLFEDRNKNRIMDPNEHTQFGFQQIYISHQATQKIPDLLYYKPDTLAPTLSGVGLLSSQRLRVRFSESIRLSRESRIAVFDSLSNRFEADWLYTDTENSSVAYAHLDTPLKENKPYSITMSMVEDVSGNRLADTSEIIKGLGQKDTTQQRLVRIQVPQVVAPQDSILLIYSKVLDQKTVADSLLLVDGDRLLRNYSGVITKANRLYVFAPKGWRSGQNYQLRAWDPFQQKHQSVSFRPLDPINYGSLELLFPDNWHTQSIIIELLDQQAQVLKRVLTTTNLTLNGVVPGEYYLRIWVDRNENGRWDPGIWKNGKIDLIEPVYVRSNLPISARMTSTIEVVANGE